MAANDSIIIKDGSGEFRHLSAYTSSRGFVAEHAISGTVSVTSSLASPLYVSSSINNPLLVTGTVFVSNPVDVNITVSDIISVTSSLNAPLFVSSSENSPLLITGSVRLTEGIKIDSSQYPILVQPYGFAPFYVSSSANNPVYVSSSANNPVLVTGAVTINNFPAVTSVTSSDNSPVLVTGAVNVGNFPLITTVTSSDNSPVLVTGAVTINNFPSVTLVTSSGNNPVLVKVLDTVLIDSSQIPLFVTSSTNNPVHITSSQPIKVNINGVQVDGEKLSITGSVQIINVPTVALNSNIVTASIANVAGGSLTVTASIANVAGGSLTVTASVQNPLPIILSAPTSANRNRYSTYGGIDYTNTLTSGSFEIAEFSNSRKGLIVFNPSSYPLYINLESGSQYGFEILDGNSQAPRNYSFILYPSGTYVADSTTINLFHAGFFISSSDMPGREASVYITRMA